jgi:hypothetical protein
MLDAEGMRGGQQMSSFALKLMLALSLVTTGCITDAASSDETSEEAANELVMQPMDGDFEVRPLIKLPTSRGECGEFQAQLPAYCQRALQAAPNSAAFDPDQRPPEDPNY